jgi:hypothetical protein
MELLPDNAGNIYVCDVNNNVVRKINSAGIITTVAGTGTPGFSGDGGPATMAQFYYPTGITFDLSGNLLIADEYNQRIRKVHPSTTGINALSLPGDISIFPNPGNGVFTIRSVTPLHNTPVEVYNMLGAKVYSAIMNGDQMEIKLSEPAGLYTLCVDAGNTRYRQKISVTSE